MNRLLVQVAPELGEPGSGAAARPRDRARKLIDDGKYQEALACLEASLSAPEAEDHHLSSIALYCLGRTREAFAANNQSYWAFRRSKMTPERWPRLVNVLVNQSIWFLKANRSRRAGLLIEYAIQVATRHDVLNHTLWANACLVRARHMPSIDVSGVCKNISHTLREAKTVLSSETFSELMKYIVTDHDLDWVEIRRHIGPARFFAMVSALQEG